MTYEFIENKTLREYYEKDGIELSDEVKAWLMYNDVILFDKRWKFLTKLAADTSNLELNRQILDAKSKEFSVLKDFRKREGGSVYTCNIESMGGAVFDDIDRAIEYGKDTTTEYEIYSGFTITKSKVNNPENDTITCIYSCEGYLVDVIPDNPKHDKPSPFVDIIPKLPHPYKRGDLVKYTLLGDEEFYGVCTLDKDITLDEWYDDLLKLNEMDPDVCEPMITLDLINCKTGHCYPHLTEILEIDKVELSDIEDERFRNLMRVYISAVNTGNGIASVIYSLMEFNLSND